MVVGSQHDDHGCVLDGGYQWCDTLNQCVRIWETNCESLINPTPILYDGNDCNIPCPPSAPCPAPGPDCNYSPPVVDNCGCSNGCGIINCNAIDIVDRPTRVIPENCAIWNDGCNTCEVNKDGTLGGCTMMYCFVQNEQSCTSYYRNDNSCTTNNDCKGDRFCRSTTSDHNSQKECVDYASENDSCGGFTLPNMQNVCHPSLECVNTLGLMIADAQGICKELCKNGERRDQYGNCINNDCRVWFDGCNTCSITDNNVNNGMFCTYMYCEIPDKAECRDVNNLLKEGDVCYRFCEDGSEPIINRRNDCPSGTECADANSISFDSCGERASICIRSGH
tara:strand:- start:32 stop:1039 length:1008 start_codon:yes stop_codon:yes gene_type:complete